ncbi:hypothetical protein [Microbispora hainanensis]|uniref:DUF998 domain-containing protein n=1 Tax=Microbispora hainanensis TaxID=568844 RepID=A0A544Z1Q9_9ACTN|nr:hypothetical protein [Microbispora hainanensis]TQS22841.1 hypothetical protein FLX08_05700 [Microbispora hainanensis]
MGTVSGVAGDVAKGQACLFGGLGVCVTLRPEGLAVNHGMSYFGVHWQTLLPYAAGLAGAALFTSRALRDAAARTPHPAHLRRMAGSFAVLLAGIVLTPYTLGGAVDWAHRGLGAALFVLQLLLAVRLVAWARGDAVGVAFFLVQLGGGVLAAVYVLQTEGLLIHGEATFQLGFALVLARTLPLLAPPVATASPASGGAPAAAPGSPATVSCQ